MPYARRTVKLTLSQWSTAFFSGRELEEKSCHWLNGQTGSPTVYVAGDINNGNPLSFSSKELGIRN